MHTHRVVVALAPLVLLGGCASPSPESALSIDGGGNGESGTQIGTVSPAQDAGPSRRASDAAATPDSGEAGSPVGSREGGTTGSARCDIASGDWNAGTNRLPANCYPYSLTNSMWANRVPVDAMDHLWNAQSYGLPSSSDYYAQNAMTARGSAAANCSSFAAAQGGPQPSGCNGMAGGHVQIVSPAVDGSRSNRDSSSSIWYATASDPVFSIGGPGNGTTCTSGPYETPNECVVFHAPAGAQYAWYGGGYCFNGTSAGAAGDPNPKVPLCEYASQCNAGYPNCLSSYSRITLQPAYDDSFLAVFDQAQQLFVDSEGGKSSLEGLVLPSCAQGSCGSVCSGHAGTMADPCPLGLFSYLAAESYVKDSDWSTGSHTIVSSGATEYIGAGADNGAGMSAGGAARVRLEEIESGIFHITGGATTGNSMVPTIWPGTVPEASNMSIDGIPGGSWIFLDYTDAQIEAMGLGALQKTLVTQLAHYGTILENWADDSFTQLSEVTESGMAYYAATGHQHPIYEWMNGQKVGVESTGFQYTINCHNSATLGDSQYNCEVDTLYGLPVLSGPGGKDTSGRSCGMGCDVTGHIHALDPSVLAGYIGPGKRAGEPTPTVGLVVVAMSGSGSGTIQSSPPGINCDHQVQCNVAGGLGKQFTLTPVATSGSFQGWSGGGCTGTGSCTLTATSSPQVVTATFN
jgi:hypothetical protein